MARKLRLLVVDDEAGFRFTLAEFLRDVGFEVSECETCDQAIRCAREWLPDLVLMDYRLPDGDALAVLPGLRRVVPDAGVVLLTGHGTIDLAVRAMKSGADHFLSKPVSLPELESTLRGLDRQRRLERTRRADRNRPSQRPLDPFLGSSRGIRRLEREATRIADSGAPVLITGPTGSGKGVLAHWIHAHGSRNEEPFVDINCASLTREFLEAELFGHERGAFTGAVAAKPGLLELAHRGSLFLDEIGDMPLEIQPRLLKVLEERRYRRMGSVLDRKVDVRILAATHHDLTARTARREFREDLYFRIQTLPLRVPALVERLEDLAELAEDVLRRLTEESGRPHVPLSARVLSALARHPWPGNVRELRNVLERALLLSVEGEIRVEDLALEAAVARRAPREAVPTAGRTLLEMERETILSSLEAHEHRVADAAVALGIPRSSLYQKMQRFGIAPSRRARLERAEVAARASSVRNPDLESES